MATVAPISYFKRYKMEVALQEPPELEVPAGFACRAWSGELLETHAAVLYASFHQEIDAQVFPSLGDSLGCVALMTEISRKRTFVPEATWLMIGPDGPCGSVQGLRERNGLGAIQNLGVTAACRGRGVGRALMLHALHGFYGVGLGRALLEVTAHNDAAVHLYRSLGFRRSKVIYKAVGESRLW
jgi:ribosomal protein S18 acetylase RimI-like enzyme